MPETYLIAGQSKPLAGVLTQLYVVPGATSFVGSTLNVCNQSSATDYFRIAAATAGAADDPKQYIAFDTPVLPNDSIPWTIGATLAATDVVRVQSRNGNISFNLFGTQIT